MTDSDKHESILGMAFKSHDYDRICGAIRWYAEVHSQPELLAILGEPHIHKAWAGHNDTCFLCHRDLRHEIHFRATEKP